MEESKYENIIAKYTDTQLLYEISIVNEQETVIYNKKKALREELKKRTGGKDKIPKYYSSRRI